MTKHFCRLCLGLLLGAASLLVAPPPGWAQVPAPTAAATPPAQDDAFQAKLLLALSDADMVPSTYLDGQLGPAAGTDALSVVAFDGRRAQPTTVQTLPVSTTVTRPPALAVTPDGRYAIAAEGLGPRPGAGGKGPQIELGVIQVEILAHLRPVGFGWGRRSGWNS